MKQFAPMYARQQSERENLSGCKPLDVQRVSFIGGGNMAEAIISAMIAQELLPADKICVSSPSPGK